MSHEIKTRIEQANQKALSFLVEGQPVWTNVLYAREVVPGFKENMLLHAGPPLKPEQVVAPLKTSLCGAAIHEGFATSIEDAWDMIMKGDLVLGSAQDHSCTCGAVMTISASTPLIVAEDQTSGFQGYASIHPGHNPKTLRWGSYDEDVEKQLCWYRDVYGPQLGEAVRRMKGINIRALIARTAGMGDEHHNRQMAASLAMICDMIPPLLGSTSPGRDQIINELVVNDRFFLHVLMAGAMSVVEAAKNIPMSTLLVGFGGNGHVCGMQFSGTGKEWFTIPAPLILGQMLNPKWTEKDIVGQIGDSTITEVYGFGGLASVAGPSYVRLTGGDFAEAQRRTNNARQVCLAEHKWAPIPWDDFRGPPVGIDMRKVVATGIVPTSHGGSVHKDGGQAGAGSMPFPMECFKQGLRRFSEVIKEGI